MAADGARRALPRLASQGIEKWMKPVHCEACAICRPQRHDWAGMYFANPEKHWCRRCWEILHPPEDKEDGD